MRLAGDLFRFTSAIKAHKSKLYGLDLIEQK